jgi:hypothetical protein
MNDDYVNAVQLLLQVAPAVFDTPVFAMKGGTAINLFLQNVPRLSVDIDVVFLPHERSRAEALEVIGNELAAAQRRVATLGFDASLRKAKEGNEVNFVFRGTVLPPERRSLTAAAQQMFSADIEVPVLATPELYGSKLVAALDRQHPRDLFDVQLMLAGGGWDEALLDCFVVYLAGHNRPTHEVLFPNRKPLDEVFEAEFVGMTSQPVMLDELLATRGRMLEELPRALHARHCDFLLSMSRGEPEWALLPHDHLERLPALQWKLQNLAKLSKNAAKFQYQHDELEARLTRARTP